MCGGIDSGFGCGKMSKNDPERTHLIGGFVEGRGWICSEKCWCKDGK